MSVTSTGKINDIDIQSPFIEIDSSRINSVFLQVLDVIKQLQGRVNSIVQATEGNTGHLAEIDAAMTKLNGRVGELTLRFDKGKDLEDIVSSNTNRIELIERRHADIEGQTADMIANSISKMNKDIAKLNESCSRSDIAIKSHDTKITKYDKDINSLLELNEKNKVRTGRLYKVFGMTETDVAKVLSTGECHADPHTSNTTTTEVLCNEEGMSKNSVDIPYIDKVEYLLGIPCFRAIRDNFTDQLAELTNSRSLYIKELNERISHLSDLLCDKVPCKVFATFENDVIDTLRRHKKMFELQDKLAMEIREKSDKTYTDSRINELNEIKADKSSILQLITQDDISRINNKMSDLQKAFDILLSKVDLDLMNIRNAPSRASSTFGAIDPAIPGRIARLEEETRDLYKIKADKKGISYNINKPTPYMSYNSPLEPSQARASSPALSSSQQDVASASRPASSHIRRQISSSYMYRPSVIVHDSNGHRTPVSVTAARAVGYTEHLNNVANHVAGNGMIYYNNNNNNNKILQ